MTIHQTEAAKRRIAPSTAAVAGVLTAMVYEHTFNAAYASATDLIEMGSFPARTQLHSVDIIGAGVGAVTADVGFLSGAEGDSHDDTREVSPDFLSAADINNATASAGAAACLAVPRQPRNTGIGVALSGDVAAGAAKKITLVLTYYA